MLTVQLKDVQIREALDIVCDAIECAWSLDQSGDEGVLRIEWID